MININIKIDYYNRPNYDIRGNHDSPSEAINIVFFKSYITNKREMLSIILDVVKQEGIEWLTAINYQQWLIDLDKLRTSFNILGNINWLQGIARVSPEFPTGHTCRFVSFTISSLDSNKNVFIDVPAEISSFLQLFHKDHRESDNCAFLMMKYQNTPIHKKVIQAVKDTCKLFNIKVLRADDKEYASELFNNIRTYMHGCRFGIAIFERINEDDINPNVSLEVGYMLALNKPVCLLKDKTLKYLTTDLIGRIYREFNPQNAENEIPKVLKKWMFEQKLINIKRSVTTPNIIHKA